ncbi:FAD-dependent monooxygenase [Myroides odoratus]|uniref:FAD-dependent monooxygenase n=1 Tax=Myroides odoratus TaxID=256 RepID=UPI0039AEDB6A
MQVAIIGAGIAGLTAAIALKKANIPFVIYEATSKLKPVGAGIAIANNAMQVYRYLGVSDELKDKGVRISTVRLTDIALNVLNETNLSYFEQKYQLANIAIHRSELHRVLVDKVGEETIELNKRLQSISKSEDSRYKLCFTDGSTAYHTHVLGTDGLRSQVRQQLFGTYPLRDAKQVCWRGILSFELPTAYKNVAVEGWGAGKRLGFVQLKGHQVYWYFLVDEDLYNGMSNLEAHLAECPSWVQEMIRQTPVERIHLDKIYDLEPFNEWYKDNVCLIGDAAHATTPNLGQGACQAIEDVYVISKLLERYSLDDALRKFPAIRRSKAHRIVRDSWRLGKIAQLRNPGWIKLRNTSFRLLPTFIKQQQMKKIFELQKV